MKHQRIKQIRNTLLVTFILCLFYFLLQNWKTTKKPYVKVLTYSSFAGLYGPGNTLKKEFEKFCNCKIEWFVAEDSTTLLQRLFVLPSIDVVIGLDQISIKKSKSNQWKDLSFLKRKLNESFLKKFPKWFIPINWAPIGFISKNHQPKIKQLKNLHEISYKISFPEPQSSTLGMQFYYWIYESFDGDTLQIKSFLEKIKSKIYGPVFSWSLSYGYFQKGHVGASLSYLSSLAYHLKEENSQNYQFHYFDEGHPYQLEMVAVPAICSNCDLAIQFVEFLLSPQAQSIIRDKNYMFAVSNVSKKNNLFDLKKPKPISYHLLDNFTENKEELLLIWKKHLY